MQNIDSIPGLNIHVPVKSTLVNYTNIFQLAALSVGSKLKRLRKLIQT